MCQYQKLVDDEVHGARSVRRRGADDKTATKSQDAATGDDNKDELVTLHDIERATLCPLCIDNEYISVWVVPGIDSEHCVLQCSVKIASENYNSQQNKCLLYNTNSISLAIGLLILSLNVGIVETIQFNSVNPAIPLPFKKRMCIV